MFMVKVRAQPTDPPAASLDNLFLSVGPLGNSYGLPHIIGVCVCVCVVCICRETESDGGDRDRRTERVKNREREGEEERGRERRQPMIEQVV